MKMKNFSNTNQRKSDMNIFSDTGNGEAGMNGKVTIPAEFLTMIVANQRGLERKYRKLAKENRKFRRRQQYAEAGSGLASGDFGMIPVDRPRQFAAPARTIDLVQNGEGFYAPAPAECGSACASPFGGRKNNSGAILGGVLAGGILGALAVGFIMSLREK